MLRVIVTGPVHDDARVLPRDAGRTGEGPGAALCPAQGWRWACGRRGQRGLPVSR